MDTHAASAEPIGFQDSRSILIQRVIGVLLVVAALVWTALGLWFSAAIAGVAAVLELVYSGGRVTVDGEHLVLHTVRGIDRVRIADVARVDANFAGSFMRTPHLVLHSGQSIALTPFRCSTMLRTRSQAAEQLAEYLGLPIAAPAAPVFRFSWFALAAVIVVGFLFGIPLLVSGVVELAGGGILSGIVLVAIGGALCAGALRDPRTPRPPHSDRRRRQMSTSSSPSRASSSSSSTSSSAGTTCC